MPSRRDYRTTDIPGQPGVYLFRDRFGEVIYVGKAKSLRKRLASYFQPSRARTAEAKLRSLIHSVADYEYYVVRSEAESLLLESRLVKQYTPRYNVLLRDDKRFLMMRIDAQAPYPRLQLARLQRDDGARYYGPFPHAAAVRETASYLARHFGLRSCKATTPGPDERRHCHDRIVRHCSAPCEQRITQEDYRQRVSALIEVLEGKIQPVAEHLEAEMTAAAAARNFERAALLRDVRQNLESLIGARLRSFAHSTVGPALGSEALADLQQALDLPQLPRVIECFDNANIGGTLAVASMVRFVDGRPARSEYRHFRIRTAPGSDDVAMMREVVTRRCQRLVAENRPLPDLLVVDGGKGQLHAAYECLLDLKLTGLPLVGLAKRLEEIYTLYSAEPVRLPPERPALRLLQSLRDEAHRFANTFHRELRRKRIRDSLLDEIPGVGPQRRRELLKAFGSVRTLRRQAPAEISRRVPGIGEKLAAEIVTRLGGTVAPPPAAPEKETP